MTAVTDSQGLVYPSGSDRLCDFPAQWGAMAEVLQSKFDGLNAVIGRTQPVKPACLLEKRTRTVFNNAETLTNPVAFDTVAMDTDNMTNLSADPTLVIPTRAGIYQAVAFAQLTITGDPTNYLHLEIRGDGSGPLHVANISDAEAAIGDDGNNWAKFLSCTGLLAFDPDSGTPGRIWCEADYFGGASANGTRVDYVSFGVFWVSDQP